MIREARQTDLADLIDLSVEALSIDPYPELVTDRLKVARTVTTCVCSAMHFSWVSEIDGKVEGALGALVAPNALHEGSVASILMLYCRKPGDGYRLVRKFKSWCDERDHIKMMTYVGERGADPRIATMIKRAGFPEQVPFYLALK